MCAEKRIHKLDLAERPEVRPRSGSLNNIEDFLKRKRDPNRESIEIVKPVAEIFKRSKLLARSPVKAKEEEKGIEMNEIKDLLKEMKDEIKEEIRLMREDNRDLREEFKKERERWEEEKQLLKKEVVDLKDRINYMENQARRDNLVFRGIAEHVKETWDDCALKVVEIGKTIGVKVEASDIVRAHRIGSGKAKPRPIVAKFLSWQVKEEFLKKKSSLKGSEIMIMEDFSSKTIEDRRNLYEEANRIRKNGEFASVRFDKLVTNKGTFRWDSEEGKVKSVPTYHSSANRQEYRPKNNPARGKVPEKTIKN